MTLTDNTKHLILFGSGCFITGILVGLAIGWKLYQPKPIQETNKPAIVINETTTVLERKPDQPIPTEIKEAAKKIGGKVERTATVVLQPKPKADAPEGCECEEITLDLGIVDQGDGKRVVASTDDADILRGSDNPLAPYNVVKNLKWEVGLIIPVENPEGVGGYVSRKIGPFSLGFQIAKPLPNEDYTAMATVGIRF